jgi:hypothetical protein
VLVVITLSGDRSVVITAERRSNDSGQPRRPVPTSVPLRDRRQERRRGRATPLLSAFRNECDSGPDRPNQDFPVCREQLRKSAISALSKLVDSGCLAEAARHFRSYAS